MCMIFHWKMLLVFAFLVLDFLRVDSLPQGRKMLASINQEYHQICQAKGREGLCMYQWECFYTGGEPIGLCQHGFQFGACCNHDANHNEVTQATTKKPEKEVFDDVIDHHTRHDCGEPSKPRKTGRIVNGTKTYLGEAPWQVSVRLFRGIEDGFQHHCGGALLNERWVVTAAHCVARNLLIETKIRAGEHDLSYRDNANPYRDLRVKKKVIHPDYLSNSDYFNLTYENDIALLELKDNVKFKRHVAPICLPGSKDLLSGRMSLITGWGRRQEDGKLSDVLQKVSLPVMSNSACEELYGKAGLPQKIPEIFLCAGHKDGGSDACNGDSGGPLVTRSKDGRFVLSGIVSWGNGCGEANKPGVYTRISKYIPWILETIKLN